MSAAMLGDVAREVPASLRAALELYRQRLVGRFGDRLRQVVLFGSWARGQATEDSDIDVLVVVDGLTPAEQWDAGGEVAPVILATGLPLAGLLMSTERLQLLRDGERALARTIDAEGIPL